MRSSTKSTIGVVTLGVLGASWYMGLSATSTTNGTFAAPAGTSTGTTSGTSSSSSSTSASGSQSGSSSTGTTATSGTGTTAGKTTKKKTKKTTTTASGSTGTASSGGSSSSSSPTPSASAPATSGGTSSAAVTKNGDAVESGFGVVQVQVTKVNGKITAINMLQANASHGREAAFPYLIQYAISANSSSFANLSGATYTTTAFKRSLESALAKF